MLTWQKDGQAHAAMRPVRLVNYASCQLQKVLLYCHCGRGWLRAPPPCRILYSLDSYNSCGWRVLTDSCMVTFQQSSMPIMPRGCVASRLTWACMIMAVSFKSRPGTHQLDGNLFPRLDVGTCSVQSAALLAASPWARDVAGL